MPLRAITISMRYQKVSFTYTNDIAICIVNQGHCEQILGPDSGKKSVEPLNQKNYFVLKN